MRTQKYYCYRIFRAVFKFYFKRYFKATESVYHLLLYFLATADITSSDSYFHQYEGADENYFYISSQTVLKVKLHLHKISLSIDIKLIIIKHAGKFSNKNNGF